MNEYAEDKVKGPAIGLLVVGILAILANIANVIWQLIVFIPVITGGDDIMVYMLSSGWSMILAVFGILGGIFVIYASRKLKSLQSPAIVYAGAVVAALPCCVGSCCCIGLPIGIWVIVTMQDEQVKGAFSE